MRKARVYSNWREGVKPQDAVAHYLPDNYSVVGWGAEPDRGTYVIIEGEDNLGWTLDDYVIPRLMSGLFFAEEVK